MKNNLIFFRIVKILNLTKKQAFIFYDELPAFLFIWVLSQPLFINSFKLMITFKRRSLLFKCLLHLMQLLHNETFYLCPKEDPKQYLLLFLSLVECLLKHDEYLLRYDLQEDIPLKLMSL